MTPSQAVKLWRSTMEPFSGQAKLVSPAVSNGVKASDGSPMGVNWLLEFISLCTGCHIDALAVSFLNHL